MQATGDFMDMEAAIRADPAVDYRYPGVNFHAK
jgi:hypothetical protein